MVNNKNIEIKHPLNVIFSQINTINNNISEIQYYNILRLYLIKSYKGRCHALGKPVKGQRTWSNSWNSYNLNKVLRNFIRDTSNFLKKNERQEKINYKLIKKKLANKSKKINSFMKNKKKLTTWF